MDRHSPIDSAVKISIQQDVVNSRAGLSLKFNFEI